MQINLLPNLVVKRRRQAQIQRLATLGLFAWGGLLVLATLAVIGYRQFQLSRQDSLTSQVKIIGAEVNSESNTQFRQEALSVQSSLTALDSLIFNQQKLSVINTVLSQLTPEGVRLRETRISPDGKVDISATAGTYTDAGKLLASMKASSQTGEGHFESVVLAGANQADSGVAFSITAVFVTAAEGAAR